MRAAVITLPKLPAQAAVEVDSPLIIGHRVSNAPSQKPEILLNLGSLVAGQPDRSRRSWPIPESTNRHPSRRVDSPGGATRTDGLAAWRREARGSR